MNALSLPALLHRLPPRGRAVVRTCAYRLGAGAATVAFQLGITWLYRTTFVPLSGQPRATFRLGSLGVVLGSALVVGWLLNSFCRSARGVIAANAPSVRKHATPRAKARGSGIPQLKVAFWKDFGYVPCPVR